MGSQKTSDDFEALNVIELKFTSSKGFEIKNKRPQLVMLEQSTKCFSKSRLREASLKFLN